MFKCGKLSKHVQSCCIANCSLNKDHVTAVHTQEFLWVSRWEGKHEGLGAQSRDVSRFSRPTVVPLGKKFPAGNGWFDASAQFVVAFVYMSLNRDYQANIRKRSNNKHVTITHLNSIRQHNDCDLIHECTSCSGQTKTRKVTTKFAN